MKSVRDRREGDVRILTLDRPDRGNSLTGELLGELCAALREAGGEAGLKAVVLTGAGDRFFCTGADLTELGKTDSTHEIFRRFSELLDLLAACPVLTAAFVNGDCVGGGLGIALSADFVLAAAHARFGTPEITKGLFPYIISRPLLQKLGEHRAKALCFGGRLWTAEEAHLHGAVSELVPTDRFAARGAELVGLWNRVNSRTLGRGKSALSADRPLEPAVLVSYLDDAVKDFRSRP